MIKIFNKFNFVFLLGVLSVSYFIFSSNSTGVTGKATSGCGGAGCHTPSIATTILFSGINSPYTYGQTYTCTLQVTNAAKVKAGFDLKVNIGTITAISGQGTTVNGAGNEVTHNAPKAMVGGTSTWTFQWKAPASGNTDLVVNVAGNAVDGNNQSTNDAFDIDAFSISSPNAGTPTITQVNASNITGTSADITADINANNFNTTALVEYGLTAPYGSTQNMSPATITGASPTPATATLNGLTPNTMYHYRIKATNTNGTTTGNDGTFTTALVSSVTQQTVNEEWNVYPNPILDYVYIESNKEAQSIKLNLISLDGKSQTISIEKLASGKYKLNTQAFIPGHYFLQIENGNKKITKLVLKR